MSEKVLIVVIGIVAGLIGGFLAGSMGPSTGGQYHMIQEDFAEGISVDMSEVIDDTGTWKADIDGTNAVLSGDVTVNGQCLVLDNASNGNSVYVTTASSSISATTTKPAVCP